MPEYLAPGVYVEETSFRSKSIEGVSTSTTAFVGPTSRGPFFDPRQSTADGIPELLTSFADFERIYGGLDDLPFGGRRTNYVAHAVRNYFDNGGSRLYVSRAFRPNGTDGRAQSAPLRELSDARFIARTPGTAGDGLLFLRQAEAPATRRSLDSAPEGSLLRVGGGATPARLRGDNRPAATLPNGGRLQVNVKPGQGAVEQVVIEVRGTRAEVVGEPLAAQIDVQAPNNVFVVTVDGVEQRITLPTGAGQARSDIVGNINRELRSGRVQLTANNAISIASDRQGLAAEVVVHANPTLGFPATKSQRGADDPNANNVADLLRVTADEIDGLLAAETDMIHAAYDPTAEQFVLSAADPGAAVSLEVPDDANDINDAVAVAFGLPLARRATGEGEGRPSYYVKRGSNWLDRDGTQLKIDTAAAGPDGVVGDLLTMAILGVDRGGNQVVYDDLGFDAAHPRWVGNALAEAPTSRAQALEGMYAVRWGSSAITPFDLRDALFAAGPARAVAVAGGEDGAEPNQAAYENALRALEQIEDISIVAAPGSSELADARGIVGALITHAERRRSYRIAVVDTPPAQTVGETRAWKAAIDSKYAALYYPWVIVSNPLARPGVESVPRELALPPSGFVCGIYARNDIERGVHKAPANEVVRGALRFESDINFAQQEVLNPLGVNCLRFFPGRGYRLWGARTASSDPEWKYVNVRRYFNYLERSIDVGTQWAVFEPNGERLWANLRNTIESFLYNEWVSGALLGANPKEAFFVRCDRTTMTQYNIDNGQLICLVGVAALKPAEFVIFRIGQKTADARM